MSSGPVEPENGRVRAGLESFIVMSVSGPDVFPGISDQDFIKKVCRRQYIVSIPISGFQEKSPCKYPRNP
jgi:hypothetical protein